MRELIVSSFTKEKNMSKQKIAGYLTGGAYLSAVTGVVLGFLMSTIGLLFILLSVVLVIFAVRYSSGDALNFFSFGGNDQTSVLLNREVISQLTVKDVAHLSDAEREFFQYCKDNQAFRMHITLSEGSKMSQEQICDLLLKTFIRSREEILRSGLIDMAEVLATEPGPNPIG
jgi:hypothetical protein